MSEIATMRLRKLELVDERRNLQMLGRQVLLSLRECLDPTINLVDLDDDLATNLKLDLTEKIMRLRAVEDQIAILRREFNIS